MAKKIFLAGLVLAAGVVFLSGCGKTAADRMAEGLIEKSTGGQADVDLSDQNMKINVNGVNLEAGEGVSLPAGFPSDVYIIDGKLISAISNVEQKSYSVYIETSFSAQEVFDQYNEKLAAAGWKVISTGNFSGVVSLNTEKDNRTLSVVASAGENGKTTVALNEYSKE